MRRLLALAVCLLSGAVLGADVAVLELAAPALDAAAPVPRVRLWYAESVPARAPAVIYFSGWPGTGIDNPGRVQALVDAGYVVATAQYPARLPTAAPGSERAVLAELRRPMDLSSPRALADSLARAELRVRTRTQDAARVLAALRRIADGRAGTALDGRINAERVGAIGYSLGGAVAAEACAAGLPLRAAVNIDGLHLGRAGAQGVSCPYLLISDGSPPPAEAQLDDPDPQTRNAARLAQREFARIDSGLGLKGGMHVVIEDVAHDDFASRDADARAPRLATRYAAAFLDLHLYGRPAALLERPGAPRVRLQPWPRVEAARSGASR